MMYVLKSLPHLIDFDLERKNFLTDSHFYWVWKTFHVGLCICVWSAWCDFENVTFTYVLTKVHGLVVHHPNDVMPKSKESRRRLKIVVNSLFMDIPDVSSIHDIFSWSVMIPYYSEDTTYSKADLEQRTNTLGVSTLLYLQVLFQTN